MRYVPIAGGHVFPRDPIGENIAMAKSPVFLLGNNRSGTTLARMMLTSHPDIIIPPESHFFMWLYEKYRDWEPNYGLMGFVKDLMGCTKIETWAMQKEPLLEYIRMKRPTCYGDIISCVYSYFGVILGRRANRWGDKNSLWPEKLHVIDAVFPKAVVVHIVRDGRDVAVSYRELAKRRNESKYSPRLPHKIEEIATIWSRNVRMVRDLGKKLGHLRYYEFRYEDLLDAPETEMRSLLRFLGMEYNPAVMQYGELSEIGKYEPPEFLTWKEKVFKPIDNRNKGKYIRLLTANQINDFERIALKELTYYKYI